jgi:GT2 family glycosyltransferase
VPEALAWYRLNEAEQTVNRKTPLHRNHMANIRPYLEAVPPGLKNLVYLAQGQELLLAHSAGATRIADPAETKLTVAWHAKVEAARMFARLKQKTAAIDLLVEAIKTVEVAKRPLMLFETLVVVGQEMQNLDPPRVQQIFRIALQLAKALKNDSMEQAAAKLIATPANAKTKSAATSIAPARANTQSAAPAQRAEPAAPTAFVSIVIPVFNNLALTRGCLESLARTTVATKFEIIVVDNASTDGTAEFLKLEESAGRIRVLTNSQNEGFSRACNLGGKAAQGSILLFLNNDNQVTNGWLDALVQAAQQPIVGVVGAKLLYADNRIQHAGIEFINGLPDHPHRDAPADAPVANQFRELDMVTGACFMIHRDLFLQLAGFDEAYRNGVEDVDLCLRARAAGRKVVYEPKAVVYHLEGQSAGRFDHVKENLTLFFERWGKSFDGKMRFVTPKFAKIFPASRSVLLTPAAPATAKPVVVAWEGSFLDFGSLSHVNRELTRELSGSKQIRLQCVNQPASQNGTTTPKELKKLAATLAAKAPADTQITIRHAWPPNWQRPAQGKLVVIQPWEFGSLPQDWVEQSKNVDEFWVPSNYVRKVYTDSGIEPGKVRVVPNGIDPERFRPGATPRKLTTTKSFKFLFVGGTIPRKGIDVLLQAFLKTFTASDDVALVIKDFGGNTIYKGQTWGERIAEIQRRPNAPEIIYLDNELAPEELPGLYTACDCLVHPYRGEGFGLPVIEAMACGLAVIVTAGGATDDFATDEFAYRIPATRRGIGHEVSGMKLAAEGWLLEPDAAALAEKLKWITANLDAARAKGRAASEHARRNWTWQRASEIAFTRLQQLAVAPSAAPQPRSSTVELPPVAKIGNLKAARELLGHKKLREAWEAALAAINARPFHPEAFLLLAEIALAAGDATSARECAERARHLAPGWDKPKQFLKKPLKAAPVEAAPRRLQGDCDAPVASQHERGKTREPEQRGEGAASTLLRRGVAATLTICLIAKNEEKFLGQCLKSICGLAQQIIVVDTGSTDRTVEIAKEHGAEVHSFAWCDDFSAARNAALEHATSDWILMLDADEELPADQHAKLLTDLKSSKAIAHRLPLVNHGQNDGQSYVPRLFRNAPGVYFHGRIHEQAFPSLVALGKTWGLDTALGTAQILHHGYTKEVVQDRDKIERNLKLLRQAIEENPRDANLAMNFGLELVRSGDLAGGIEKYREAIRLMSAQKPGDVVPELREVLLTQFTSHLYKICEHDEVVRTLGSPLAKNGGLTASLHFALGLSNFELKNYREAAEQMRQCLAKRNQTALSPINTDIHTCAPNHCLALSLAKLGDHPGAEKAFLAALSRGSDASSPQGRCDAPVASFNETKASVAAGLATEASPSPSSDGASLPQQNVKLDYAKFLASQNRQLDALHKLNEIVAQNSRNAAAWRLGGEIALSQPDFLEFARDWTGEATRHLAEDIAITAQRAEVLLLSGDTASARELWERIYSTEPQPRALAALILCEAIESQTTHAPDEGAQETHTSREFIAWYQKLLATKAHTVVGRLNDQTEKLSRALPTAAGIIEKALFEVEQGELVATAF